MRRTFLTLLLPFFILSGFAQESAIKVNAPTLVIKGNDTLSVINGTAPGAEGKTIQLSAPADLITFLEKPLASTQVGADSKFSLAFKVEQTMVAILSINFHKAEIFVEPGKTQRVLIDSSNYNDIQEINPFIQSQSLKLQILFEEPYDLNFVIGEFNGMYNTFVLNNFNALYRDRDKSKVDSFRVQVNARFGAASNPYFKSYVAYKIASIEQLTRYYSATELARRYFLNRPVLYFNLEYMDFFSSYFSKYLTVTSKALHLIDYVPILKGPDSYGVMMKTLATDTLLRNEQLKELVLLKGLMEMYNDAIYKQEQVLAVIRAVAEKSKNNDNKVIAENMVAVLTKLKPGTAAPGFTLTDRTRNPVSLADFKGKGVVLSFWTTYCQGCLSEMDLVRPLYDKYKNKVAFVSVSADADFNKMLMFVNLKRDYIWTFLHIGDQSEVLSNYDVRSYPLFVLIDKTGKIYKYPADLPGSGLDAAIETMIQE